MYHNLDDTGRTTFAIAPLLMNNCSAMSLKSHHQLAAQSHTRFAMALVAVFLLAQLAVLWHAESHAVHDCSEACSVFQTAEHQPGLAISGADVNLAVSWDTARIVDLPKTDIESASLAFLARAPPVLAG